ncbi:MAG: gliding motility-associated protein GldE [Muribaculaceae bacterium]|nr:gliding motility-associated protein GldE [Muribaculaceae bacterium]
MAPPSWGGWIAIVAIAVLCLAMSAFVSGSEIAFFGLRPSEIDELEESEDANSKKAQKLLDNSEKLLATILISNNLVNITMVVLLTFAISQVTHFYSETLNFLVQTVFLTFLLLLFGEIFPKLVARGRALKWVRSASPALSLISSLTSPLANIMVRSTYFVNKFIRKKEDSISADELEKALEISDISEGKEKEMLEGILTFGDKEVSEIMISRVDVTAIEFHDSWDEAMRVILETGYSRIPVYDTSQDAIRGILYSKDLLPYIGNRDNSFRWQTLLREPYFVPESRMIDDLLEDFRKRKIHIAIVVDEYGGTSGIVTLEDIIEEIVGEIDDEYDEAQHLYRRIGPDTFIFDAKIPLSDFCHACGIEEEQLGNVGDAETLAGILLEIKGDFPTPGEKLSLGPCRFIVLEMEKHRILKVKTTIVEADSDDGN